MDSMDPDKIGALLVARGLVTEADVAFALSRQKLQGGVLGENLVAMGVTTQHEIDMALCAKPKAPRSLADTGMPVSQC